MKLEVMGSARGAARRAAGFTLIELLVVFALLALIVGLVPIAFGRLHESAQYRDTVRAVLTELRAARAGYQAPQGKPDKRARRLIRALGDVDAI